MGDQMWNTYQLELVVDKLTGGLPKHPEIVRRWQEAKWPTGGDAVTGKTIEQATAETIDLIGEPNEEVSGIWTGFVSARFEEPGIQFACIEARIIKAMLKEAANIVKNLTLLRDPKTGKTPGYLRSKVAERVFVSPRLIRVCEEDKVKSAERPIHVMTMRGPRTALKRVDYVEDVPLSCTLRVLNDKVITEKVLRVMLDYAQDGGLGTDRSIGSGTFTYKLTSLT